MRELEEGRFKVSFGCFFLGLFIIFLVLTQGCSNNIPQIDVTLWAGDSSKDGVSRSQSGTTLACKDPSFDNYVCMTYGDLQKIYATMTQCKQWGVPTMTSEQSIQLINKNRGVMEHVLGRKKVRKLESLLN